MKSYVYLTVLTNVLLLIFASYKDWGIFEIIWVYIGQNAAIAICTLWRISALDYFSCKDGHGEESRNLLLSKVVGVVLFLFSFSFIHGIYSVFLIYIGGGLTVYLDIYFVICVLAFLVENIIYYKNVIKIEKYSVPNLNSIIAWPFLRAMPIHLTLIFGGLFFSVRSDLTIMLFIFLCTLANLIMEYVENRPLEKIRQEFADELG